ncbi:MAG: hypothetical protein ACE5ER_12340 [Nitrospinaceae bacterium]
MNTTERFILWFLAALTIFAGLAWLARLAEAHVLPAPVEAIHVQQAAQAEGVPIVMLLAVWDKECWRKARCKIGPAREYGPFQIRAIAARDSRCRPGWREGAGNARCAARIIAKAWRKCGWRRLGAFSRYNWPAARCARTRYAIDTFRRMRAIQRLAEANRSITLAMIDLGGSEG